MNSLNTSIRKQGPQADWSTSEYARLYEFYPNPPPFLFHQKDGVH